MATMGDMPYMAGQMMTIRSWHNPSLIPYSDFPPKNDVLSSNNPALLGFIDYLSTS